MLRQLESLQRDRRGLPVAAAPAYRPPGASPQRHLVLLGSAGAVGRGGDGFKQLRFHGHEVIIFQVLDRDETEFPFTESRLFEDLETGVRRMVTPAAAREGYLARFNAFMEAHRDLFRSLEMTHCVVRTDENPWRALALFLAERKRLK